MKRLFVGGAVLLALAVTGLLAAVWFLNFLDEGPLCATTEAAAGGAEQIAQGAYLARAGNCRGCHTAPGGAPYAGGRALPTPFGSVHAPNLTPDEKTGDTVTPTASVMPVRNTGDHVSFSSGE